MARFIDPTTDFGFKKIFGNEANKEIILELPLFDERLPEYSLDRRINKWLFF